MSAYFENGFMVEEPAWHGLGAVIPKDHPATTDVKEAIKVAGLDWKVFKVPLFVPKSASVASDDDEAISISIPKDARGKRAIGHWGVFRDSDYRFIGCVGKKYSILQNKKAFEWFQPWLDSGSVKFETAGSLYDGAVVWVLGKVQQDDDEIIPGDAVKRYILLSTSHDGSQATYAGFSGIRVVCANTLRFAQDHGSSKLLKCRHTKGQNETLKLIQKTMDLANEDFKATADQYRLLARTTIKQDDLVSYVKVVLKTDEGTEAKPKELSTKMGNIIDRIVDNYRNGRGSELATGTAWGAYNAVTEWLSYDRGTVGEKRLKSLWFGDGARLNQRALDVAVQHLAN